MNRKTVLPLPIKPCPQNVWLNRFPAIFYDSRQYIYYKVRVLESDVSEDGGVETRDLFKVLTDIGAPPEPTWPYVPANLYAVPPASLDIVAAVPAEGWTALAA